MKKRGDEVESERLVAMADAYYHAVCFLAHQAEDSRAKLVYLVEARPAAADAVRLKPGQPLDVTLR